jgi:Rrf2 family protein
MLTQTSESAIRLLIDLAQQGGNEPQNFRQIAEKLEESPTYMAKITRLLVRANILRAHRGALGGVTLNRPPQTITMLSIVEACQGVLVGDYCQQTADLAFTCAYHQAGAELHQAISDVLSRWTLADLVERPKPSSHLAGILFCRMQSRWKAANPANYAPARKQSRARTGSLDSSRMRGRR